MKGGAGGKAGDTLRAFVALDLPAGFRERIAEASAPLRSQLSGARFVAPEGIHLTLRFLGQAHPDQLLRLQPALLAAARACRVLEARVSGLETFPARGSPRVLWLGLQAPADPLLRLQAACEGAARDAGFDPESREYRPHLTLARWRAPTRRPLLPSLELGEIRLEQLVLVRSELHPKGARYTPLATYALAGAAGNGGAR